MTVFTSAEDARRFVRGGNATLTIRSHKSGEHRTYRVSKKDDDSPFFVGLLTGSDNNSDYSYIGIMNPNDGSLRLTTKSKLTADAVPVRAWNYVAGKLARNELPADADVMHEGRCCRCNRLLTTPESLINGIGPECSKKVMG